MKLSVAMCTYNGAEFVRAQLESIAEQTRLPDELVVVDDSSTDNTAQLVSEFQSRARFAVHLTVNERQLGSTRNFEKAIGSCIGDVIALSDQDDVWRPQKLAVFEQLFAERPRIGLVFSDAEIVDQDLRSMNRRLWQEIRFDKVQQDLIRRGCALEVLLPGYTVTGATMAFRSAFKELVLPIPIDIPVIHDGWIAAMIAAVAEVDFIKDSLIRYRQHPSQQIGVRSSVGSQSQPSKTKVAGLHEAMHRQYSYATSISVAEKIQERLRERRECFHGERALADIEARIAHLNTRANLPQSAFKRFGCVLREFAAMRYHRYSRGTASAAKDLVNAKNNNAHHEN